MLYERHFFEHLPSLPLWQRDDLPRSPAVYFVVEGDAVLYVGRTTNMYYRWLYHHVVDLLGSLAMVRIVWYPCSESYLDELEWDMIKRFAPPFNLRKYAPSLMHVLRDDSGSLCQRFWAMLAAQPRWIP
jgi:hypothetical protein